MNFIMTVEMTEANGLLQILKMLEILRASEVNKLKSVMIDS
jgi:hypothetical protein